MLRASYSPYSRTFENDGGTNGLSEKQNEENRKTTPGEVVPEKSRLKAKASSLSTRKKLLLPFKMGVGKNNYNIGVLKCQVVINLNVKN